MKRLDDTTRKRLRRKIRIRKKIYGTAARPRVSIYKSNRFTYLQAIDDDIGVTLAAASNREKDLNAINNNLKNIEKLGHELGKRMKDKNINTAVFDRNGYLYHGIVKAIADGLRKTGIQV